VERARKAHRGDDAAEIKAAMEELTAAYQEAGRSLYSQAQSEAPSQDQPPAGDGGAAGSSDGATGTAKPDDVVEADYEIVDDKK
jgi:molecular chaperone DnaK